MRVERGHGKLYRRRSKADNRKFIGNYVFKLDGREVNTRTRDRKEAERYRNKILAEARATHPARPAVTVAELLDALRARYQDRLAAETTETARRRRRNSLARFDAQSTRIRATFGSFAADDLMPAQVDTYTHERLRANAARATINRELETLRAALRLGERKRMLTRAPIAIDMLAVSNVRQGFLDKADYQRLLESFGDAAIRLMFVIGYHTGWRAQTILDLEWSHVDFGEGVIHRPRPSQEQMGRPCATGQRLR